PSRVGCQRPLLKWRHQEVLQKCAIDDTLFSTHEDNTLAKCELGRFHVELRNLAQRAFCGHNNVTDHWETTSHPHRVIALGYFLINGLNNTSILYDFGRYYGNSRR